MMNIERELIRDGYHLFDTDCFINGSTLFKSLVDKHVDIDHKPSNVTK